MALWQYTFQILTRRSFEFFNENYTPNFDDNDFDDEPYWQFESIDKSYFEKVASILVKNKSWSNEIDLYGSQESTCLEVFFDKKTNRVVSVSLRIDFTIDYDQVLNKFLEFCIMNGLIILDERLNLVSLNFESANSSIKKAPQVEIYNNLSGRHTRLS